MSTQSKLIRLTMSNGNVEWVDSSCISAIDSDVDAWSGKLISRVIVGHIQYDAEESVQNIIGQLTRCCACEARKLVQRKIDEQEG